MSARGGAPQLLAKLKPSNHPAVLPLLLLLFALSTVFLFGNNRSYFYRGDHHGHLSSQSMALAANLSPEHHFLMFFRQTPGMNGAHGYEPYNRFPIGTYALIKLSILPFADSLAKQIYAARILMLSCFTATAVLAYYALCRLVSNRWVALAATLLSFSSTYCLYYNDMISTEITSLFGALLIFHGMVVFVQERRFRQLLIKAFLALLLGWNVYSIIMPFIFFGFVSEIIRKNIPTTTVSATVTNIILTRHPIIGVIALLLSISFVIFNFTNVHFFTHGKNILIHFLHICVLTLPFVACGFVVSELLRGRLGRSVYVLIESRYLLLGIAALFFGTLILAFNLTNEYFALEGEATLTELPTFQSMLWRLGLAQPEQYASDSSIPDWLPFLQGQLSRIGVVSTPFSLFGYTNMFEVGYDGESNGPLSIFVGAGVLGVGLIGLTFVRPKVLMATLVLSGLGWGLTVRHSTHFHDFESLFYIGIPLTCFSLVPLYVYRKSSDRFLAGIVVSSLLIFALSSFQIGRIGHDVAATEFQEALLTDFDSIRRITSGDKRVLVLFSERNAPFSWGQLAVNYYLAGNIIGYERDGHELADYDFVVTSKREEGNSLLTPENRYVFLYATAVHRGG